MERSLFKVNMQRLRLNIRVSFGCGLMWIINVESVGGYWLNHCDLYG